MDGVVCVGIRNRGSLRAKNVSVVLVSLGRKKPVILGHALPTSIDGETEFDVAPTGERPPTLFVRVVRYQVYRFRDGSAQKRWYPARPENRVEFGDGFDVILRLQDDFGSEDAHLGLTLSDDGCTGTLEPVGLSDTTPCPGPPV